VEGITIVKPSPARFYKNLNNLNINIKNNLETSIVFNLRKTLINNKYIPIKIKFLIIIDYYLKLLINKMVSNCDKLLFHVVLFFCFCFYLRI